MVQGRKRQMEVKMKYLMVIPFIGLTGCSITQAMDENSQAIQSSTCAIYDNVQAVRDANQAIDENRRELDSINALLKKAG